MIDIDLELVGAKEGQRLAERSQLITITERDLAIEELIRVRDLYIDLITGVQEAYNSNWSFPRGISRLDNRMFNLLQEHRARIGEGV